MNDAILGSRGYGWLRKADEALYIKTLSDEEQKTYIKKLWLEDPEVYYEWKEYCIELSKLPELFGTKDNPIHIDESKL